MRRTLSITLGVLVLLAALVLVLMDSSNRLMMIAGGITMVGVTSIIVGVLTPKDTKTN